MKIEKYLSTSGLFELLDSIQLKINTFCDSQRIGKWSDTQEGRAFAAIFSDLERMSNDGWRCGGMSLRVHSRGGEIVFRMWRGEIGLLHQIDRAWQFSKRLTPVMEGFK